MKLTESKITKIIRTEASDRGIVLWRNNVGACYTAKGGFIRYGLANESKEINEKFKSSDLIGIKPIVITEEMVDSTIGQFVAIEVKKQGWTYSATPREKAQAKFLLFVTEHGGMAKFMSGTEV